jgi:hypothetical protein
MVSQAKRADLIRQTFGGLDDEHYPGSTQKRRPSEEERKAKVKAAAEWDAHPLRRTVPVGNKKVSMEFFTIGAFSKALGKKPVTIRLWIRKGWLPKPQYLTAPVNAGKVNASRRLWTRQQVEGIVAIAKEEGVYGLWRPNVMSTNFVQRVRTAWKDWL